MKQRAQPVDQSDFTLPSVQPDSLNIRDMAYGTQEKIDALLRRQLQEGEADVASLATEHVLEDFPVLKAVQTSFFPMGPLDSYGRFNARELSVNIAEYDEAIIRSRMQQRPESTGLIARLYGIEPHEVTPTMKYLHVVFHEFGHAVDYLSAHMKRDPHVNFECTQDQKEAALDSYLKTLKQEHSTYPIPYMSMPVLVRKIEDGSIAEEVNHPVVRGRLKRLGIEQDDHMAIRRAQYDAYKNTRKERYADAFAVMMMQRYRVLWDEQHRKEE